MTSNYTATVRAVEILLVEDNPADVRLTHEAFKDARVLNRIHVATDGVDALAYLRRESGFEDRPRPDLVLLDLNLPRKRGEEVLVEMKQDPALRRIPVIVLTTSRADQDILNSYNQHANCYINKPIDLNSFFDVVRTIEGFWLKVVRLPPE